MIILALLLSFFAATIEATLWQIPLTLLIVVAFGIFSRQYWVMLLAIVAGIALDSLTFRPLGESSVFFLFVIGVLFLYGRKFETDHVLFGSGYTFLASVAYVVIFGTTQLFSALLGIACIAFIVFPVCFFIFHLASRGNHLVFPRL